jgi:glycosyltransferase involved in cell wall biosynthesis
MAIRSLTALPVYNERAHVEGVLAGALSYSREVLVVDDGSTDGTGELLAARSDIQLVQHERNRGYGAALLSAFQFAIAHRYDVLVTIDCDGQHQPQLIPRFLEAVDSADIVSGSRYLRRFPGDTEPPEDRQHINRTITAELNRLIGLDLTDAFCGFKAYRVSALVQFELTENGYAMPLELWVQAWRLGLKIVEMPVPLIYLDLERSFGGSLDHGETRLAVYRKVIADSLRRSEQRNAGSDHQRFAACCQSPFPTS